MFNIIITYIFNIELQFVDFMAVKNSVLFCLKDTCALLYIGKETLHAQDFTRYPLLTFRTGCMCTKYMYPHLTHHTRATAHGMFSIWILQNVNVSSI